MKRRNAECGKIRRPMRRTKIAEGIYGSTFLYLKFLLVWALVLLADFILEFRFEYLWPFWLLLRSVYDSFKYQGLAFSVFFIFIALTSDMICFLFIPVHWLFFAASTYVWVQYVWHTERGICLPTVSLWLLFVYIEASVRLKELKNLPFHLDLCRPFAAHCIGYPVVTLGFGFKSYVGYKFRLRKQKDVARENDFYMQLLQQALPSETASIAAVSVSADKLPDRRCNPKGFNASTLKFGEELLTNGHAGGSACAPNHSQQQKKGSFSSASGSGNSGGSNSGGSPCNGSATGGVGSPATFVMSLPNTPALPTSQSVPKYSELDSREVKRNVNNNNALHLLEKQLDFQIHREHSKRTVNDFDEADEICERDKTAFKGASGITLNPPRTPSGNKWMAQNNVSQHQQTQPTQTQQQTQQNVSTGKKNKNNLNTSTAKEIANNHINTQKDEHLLRLESDIKRLKADLQASRQCEQELRTQIHSTLSSEKAAKSELAQCQQDNENLQTKLHNLVTARQQDKQNMSQLEKKFAEERRLRGLAETQLAAERKAKKAYEEASAAAAAATAAAAAANARTPVVTNTRTECSDNCKLRRRDLENDMKQLRRELKLREEHIRQVEREAQTLRQYKDSHGETDVLMSALSAMQDKNTHLENSLSAETRIKLDLFSALGEAKRQLEIAQTLLSQREKEIEDLKSKVAEVMAVMPSTAVVYPTSLHHHEPPSSPPVGLVSPILYTPKYLPSPPPPPVEDPLQPKSTLDPNASVYTPKGIPSDL